MATNKVVLRTIQEFMSGYTPIYQPIYPLFLGKSQSYSEEVGRIDFRRAETIGDIRSKHITPKDTEMFQVNSREGTKSLKKYFLGSQYMQSALQDSLGVEDVMAQVLDEHQKQFDELFLLGEGTSNSTMINNGLFWSNDANYDLESSATISLVSSSYLADMHAKILTSALKADQVAGRKILMFYGTDILPLFDSVYPSVAVPFKRVLADVLGSNYSIVKMPPGITPAGENGWLIANQDQLKLHYTSLPAVKAQGVNEEKMYVWTNFLMGSSMLECLAGNAVIRQPTTLGS